MSDTPNDSISAPLDTLTALLGFVNPLDVNRAYESSGWNVEKYVKRLVKIVEDENTAPRVALAAAEILRLHAESVLQISGRHPAGAPRLTGTVAAEVLPAADLALLEDRAARTQSMLKSDGEPIVAEGHVEDSGDGSDDQVPGGEAAERQEICSNEGVEGAEGSGGTESGTGQVSTEEVIGHRPSAGTRRGLCGSRPDSGGSS